MPACVHSVPAPGGLCLAGERDRSRVTGDTGAGTGDALVTDTGCSGSPRMDLFLVSALGAGGSGEGSPLWGAGGIVTLKAEPGIICSACNGRNVQCMAYKVVLVS